MRFLDVDLKNSTDKVLVFRKFPYAQWAIGLAITIIGVVMINFVSNKKEEMANKLYHYLTAIVITLLGLFFIIYGKIHIIEIDKHSEQIRKNQRSIFCGDKLMVYDLKMIKGVKGF